MKILLLLLGLLFSGGLFADMNYICETKYNSGMYDYLEAKCERNNILVLTNIPQDDVVYVIGFWCRHDREINYQRRQNEPKFDLTCVLYDNEARQVK